jgi:hypothetical protein
MYAPEEIETCWIVRQVKNFALIHIGHFQDF